MQQFTDSVTLAGTRRTNDGYLVADIRCARTGIQVYAGSELGKPDRAMIRVWRSPEEVFARDSKISFAHKPVTVGHPSEPVTAENWKRFAVGDVGDEIVEDGAYIRVPMKLMDAAAIARVEAGEREVSMGYAASVEFSDGVTPDGERYDAVMKNIRINHLAIVPKGRAGSECRVGDGAHHWGVAPQPALEKTASEKTTMTTKIVVDGVTMTSLEDAAAAVTSLQVKVKDAEEKAVADAATHKKAIEAKDGEIAALKAAHDGETAALKKQVADAEANLDDRIAERQGVIDTASRILGRSVDAKGKDITAIRREAVASRLGDADVKDRDAAYIVAAFDVLAKSAPAADPLRNALKDAGTFQAQDADGWSSAISKVSPVKKAS